MHAYTYIHPYIHRSSQPCCKCIDLRDINIQIHIFLVPSQILRLDQARDALLDHRHVGYEMALDGVDGERLELLELELLLRFHDAHDGGVQIMFTVALDERLSTNGLFSLFELS